MGRKINPVSFRLPLNLDWQSKWFSRNNYAKLLHNDLAIRSAIINKYKNAGIAVILIARGTNEINVTIRTAKPGMIIGRSGAGVADLKTSLEKISTGRIRLNIEEVKKADACAALVAQNIASQIERRVSYRRAMRQALEKAAASGVKGIKIKIGGRLNGAEIARVEKMSQGTVTLSTLRNKIDYAQSEAKTTYGVIGIKVWIYLGETDATAQES